MYQKILLTLVTVCLGASVARSDDFGCRGFFGHHLVIVGLTQDQRLIAFSERFPSFPLPLVRVNGLTMDARLVGIDYRPANGTLYGLGNAGGIYTLDRSGTATLRSRLDQPLTGSSFGVDFNPTVDRLRVVSDTGQNLRVNVDTGATTLDGTLNYVGPPPVGAMGVTGAAYTNNDADPNTATTLYCLDTMLDQIVVQAPPNAGSLNPTGRLTVDAGSSVGFDIYSHLRDGTTTDVEAFASLVVGGQTRFYEVNLITGRARLRGSFRSQDQVIDIAIPLNQR
jgi:hypothetical protein